VEKKKAPAAMSRKASETAVGSSFLKYGVMDYKLEVFFMLMNALKRF
jgi:hypothetical protein